jgi:CubicO group peptidase (beta-lactamase class C family)
VRTPFAPVVLRRRLSMLAAIAVIAGRAPQPSASPRAVAAQAAGAAKAVFPAERWDRVASPESAGFSRAKLDAAAARAKTMATTSFVAVVDGRVLQEYGDVMHLSYIASVRKSVLAMLYGSYVKSGKIRLEKALKDLKINDVGGLSDQEREATVADLLGARSGVYHPASYAGDDLASAPPRGSQKHLRAIDERAADAAHSRRKALRAGTMIADDRDLSARPD